MGSNGRAGHFFEPKRLREAVIASHHCDDGAERNRLEREQCKINPVQRSRELVEILIRSQRHILKERPGIPAHQRAVLLSGIELPYKAIRSNIAEALNLIVQIERRDGKRFVKEILRIDRYDPVEDRYALETIYQWKEQPE